MTDRDPDGPYAVTLYRHERTVDGQVYAKIHLATWPQPLWVPADRLDDIRAGVRPADSHTLALEVGRTLMQVAHRFENPRFDIQDAAHIVEASHRCAVTPLEQSDEMTFLIQFPSGPNYTVAASTLRKAAHATVAGWPTTHIHTAFYRAHRRNTGGQQPETVDDALMAMALQADVADA